MVYIMGKGAYMRKCILHHQKFLVVALVICIFLSMNRSSVVFAQEGSETAEAYELFEEMYDYYRDDPEFNKMYENDPDQAIDYIWKLVYDKIENPKDTTRYTNTYGTVAYCTVPVKTQSNNSNCSVATLLQTMYGLGKQGNIYGSTDSDKMTTLYNYTTDPTAPGARIESTWGSSLWVYEITLYLNNQINTRYYSYYNGYNMSFSDFKDEVWDSLVYNRPVLLQAITDTLPYYNGTTLYHYLSVDQYDKSTAMMRIKDCNYNSSYGGSHTVTAYQAYGTIHRQDGEYRYLIAY